MASEHTSSVHGEGGRRRRDGRVAVLMSHWASCMLFRGGPRFPSSGPSLSAESRVVRLRPCHCLGRGGGARADTSAGAIQAAGVPLDGKQELSWRYSGFSIGTGHFERRCLSTGCGHTGRSTVVALDTWVEVRGTG